MRFEGLVTETVRKLDGEPCLLGIDEAGRGPVLGPMVYGCCYAKVSDAGALKQMGFADSKVLNEAEREELFELIKESEQLGWEVIPLHPVRDLSAKMLRRSKYNLNAISHDTAIALIQHALDHGVNVQEVYVDTVGTAQTYQDMLKKRFPEIGKIVVAKKADSLYPVVSAASICAKVTRDNILKKWSFGDDKALAMLSTEFGSGYPGDPKTVSWLKKAKERIFGYPSIMRFSWKTCTLELEKGCVPVQWPDGQEDILSQKRKKLGAAITDFFANKLTKRKRNDDAHPDVKYERLAGDDDADDDDGDEGEDEAVSMRPAKRFRFFSRRSLTVVHDL